MINYDSSWTLLEQKVHQELTFAVRPCCAPGRHLRENYHKPLYDIFFFFFAFPICSDRCCWWRPKNQRASWTRRRLHIRSSELLVALVTTFLLIRFVQSLVDCLLTAVPWGTFLPARYTLSHTFFKCKLILRIDFFCSLVSASKNLLVTWLCGNKWWILTYRWRPSR